MSETATDATTNPTDASTSAAEATTLLTGTEGATTTEQQGDTQQETTTPEKNETAAETKLEGAPESYDFKAPDGKEYDPALLTSFSQAAKEANLTQDAAQKLIDSMSPQLATRQAEQVKAIQEGWMTSSKDDKEFGGAQLQQNLSIAKKALDQFSPNNPDGSKSEFRKLLDNTGLGNHPEMIRFLYRTGKGMSEDGFVKGAPGGEQRQIKDVLYDKTPKGA